MKRFDIAIIGLGVYGSAVSAAFAERGWRVLGVEQSAEDQVRGASCGPVRMARINDPERPGLAGLAAESVEQWSALSAAARRPLFRAAPAIFAQPPGAGHRLLDGGGRGWRLAVDDPILIGVAVPDGWLVTVEDGGGLLDAPAAVRALRERARAHGAVLRFGHRVEPDETPPAAGSPALVRVGPECVEADQLLFCTGPWSAGLPGWAGIPGVRVVPQYLQVAVFDGIAEFRRDAFYIFGEGDGRFCVMAFGWGNALQFGHFVPAAGDEGRTDAMWRRDVAALRRYVPGLSEVRERTTVRACFTIPPGGSFVLRRGSPSTATLVSCSGVGFKFAPAIAGRVVDVFEGREHQPTGLRLENWAG